MKYNPYPSRILVSGKQVHKDFVGLALTWTDPVKALFALDRTVCAQDDALLIKSCNRGNQSGV
jgi:hypothetical protein